MIYDGAIANIEAAKLLTAGVTRDPTFHHKHDAIDQSPVRTSENASSPTLGC
jgi:hypothetical protein